MFRRKLQALECPLANSFECDDEAKFRNLVVWLEDQKIRHYQEDNREGLRSTKGDNWPGEFQKYLQDLDINSTDVSSRTEITDQLLALAVRLDYGDNVDKLKEASSTIVKAEKEQAPKIVAANPLDKLDFSSPEFIKGVNDLADLLKVTQHPNHLVTLEACAKLVKNRYSKEAIKNGENRVKKGASFPFQDVDTSIDSGDNVLNQAAKILRLLYIMDLRDLQTKINECIVAVQTITANPKTDTKLGKVGY